MPIFPVSLMISGISFVSSILEEISSSNWTKSCVNRRTLNKTTFAYQRNFYRLRQGMRQRQFCPLTASDTFGINEMTALTCSLTLSEVWSHHCISFNTFRISGLLLHGLRSRKKLTDCSSRSSNWDLPFQYPQVLIFVRTKRTNFSKDWPSFSTSNRLLLKKSD